MSIQNFKNLKIGEKFKLPYLDDYIFIKISPIKYYGKIYNAMVESLYNEKLFFHHIPDGNNRIVKINNKINNNK